MRAALALALILLGTLALALAPAAVAAPAQATQSEIEGEVMCPVCGTLLELAESPQALREKAFIARLVDEGRSTQEIKDALVAQYGTEVLALPQGSGFDLSAYLVPVIAFLVALVALGVAVTRWRRQSGPPSDGGTAGPSDEDAERLEADLARYDL